MRPVLNQDRRRLWWVQELVRHKLASAKPADVTAPRREATSFSTLRADLWQEIIAAVATYNEAIGSEEVIVALQAEGRIGIAKRAYPAGYLDVVPDREAMTFVVTIKVRKSADAPVSEHVVEGGCQLRDGQAWLTWFGTESTPAEIVQRILTPFFDQI
jgi:hypothetical protein